MKQDLTELVFILDKSGSMEPLTDDTVGGFNSLLKKQRGEDKAAIVTTVLFNDTSSVLHDRIPIAGVAPITTDDYCADGCTALYDAVGATIRKITSAQKNTVESERPARTLVVITTDGMENASRSYNAAQIRNLISERKECGWEFIFLGANIDSVKAAGDIGISAERSVNYCADRRGVAMSYGAVSAAVQCCCEATPLCDSSWRAEADADYEDRFMGGSDDIDSASPGVNGGADFFTADGFVDAVPPADLVEPSKPAKKVRLRWLRRG